MDEYCGKSNIKMKADSNAMTVDSTHFNFYSFSLSIKDLQNRAHERCRNETYAYH